MTTRQLTQEEIDNAPEWADHFSFAGIFNDICFIGKKDNVGMWMSRRNIFTLSKDGELYKNSLPIPTTATKVIEFKEGEILSALSVKMIQFGHLVSEDRYIYSQADKRFEFIKDCTITIEVK